MFNLNIYNLMILFMEVQADNGLYFFKYLITQKNVNIYERIVFLDRL